MARKPLVTPEKVAKKVIKTPRTAAEVGERLNPPLRGVQIGQHLSQLVDQRKIYKTGERKPRYTTDRATAQKFGG